MLDRYIGYATVALLLGVAVWFVDERTAFVDIAFHLFEQARTGEVAIQNYRFVSVLTQFIPTQLLASGSAFSVVVYAYSLAFPMFYALTWALLHFIMRDRTLALAWALTWLCFATHTHYWIQSELPQGLAILCLSMGVMSSRTETVPYAFLNGFLLVSLLFTAAFAHPLLIVPATFGFGYLGLSQRANYIKLIITALIYYASYAIRYTYFYTWYDDTSGSAFWPTFDAALAGNIPYSINNLAHNLITTYGAFTLLLIIGLAGLYLNKNKLSACWTLAAVLGHFVLVAFNYPTEATRDFYIENLYLPAGFMAMVGFAKAWKTYNQYTASKVGRIALVCLISFRVTQIIYIGNDVYTSRYDYLLTQLEKYRTENVIIQTTDELRDKLIIVWGTPYEAWVINSKANQAMQGYVVHDYALEFKPDESISRQAIFSWHKLKQTDLPEQRFSFTSDQPYRVIIDPE